MERIENIADGSISKITVEDVLKAEGILKKYQRAKANLDERIIENEQWFKLRYYDNVPHKKGKLDPLPNSAWLLNCLLNKHADAMDNYPTANVLPRARDDEADAKILSEILPVVLEQNQYEETYDDVWWRKLKTGTGVTGVFWDSKKENGLGDVDIRKIDVLRLFWQPGIADLQDSQNVFSVDFVDKESLKEQYPNVDFKGGTSTLTVKDYLYEDSIDRQDDVVVVDWYYKRLNANGKTILHYCKFAEGQVIYASENDPVYADRGYYDHGKYPFVVDVLFPIEGTIAGFGYVEICKSPQLYIDKLDEVILRHGLMAVQPRFWVKGDGSIDENEFADWSKPFVHYLGSSDPNESIIPIKIPDIPSIYPDLRELKINELKETSGNRDFSQGSTASGVTAASAIAALQEAGSKLSRDMIKSSYRATTQIYYLVIELMRQFYTEPRYFRVMDNKGMMEYVAFQAQAIQAKPVEQGFGLERSYRVPVFDIKVVPEKSSPFSQVAQNERAKELYGLGFFRPDLADQSLSALDMMQFDGIEKVRDRIQENGTLYQQVQMMQQQMLQMAQIIDSQNPSSIAPQIAQQMNNGVATPGTTDANGDTVNKMMSERMNGTAGKARARVAESATPKV